MEKYSDLYYIHNVWGGLEIKIPDLIMISINLIISTFCFLLLVILYLINKFKKPKADMIQVGPLCHLCIFFNHKQKIIFHFFLNSSRNFK